MVASVVLLGNPTSLFQTGSLCRYAITMWGPRVGGEQRSVRTENLALHTVYQPQTTENSVLATRLRPHG